MFSLSSGYSAALPTCSQRAASLVSVSLSHINTLQSRSSSLAPPLAAVSPPLSPGHLSSGSSLFVSQWRARGLCCVRVLPAIRSVNRPLGVYFPCPPPVSLSLPLAFSLFPDTFTCSRSSFFFFPLCSLNISVLFYLSFFSRTVLSLIQYFLCLFYLLSQSKDPKLMYGVKKYGCVGFCISQCLKLASFTRRARVLMQKIPPAKGGEAHFRTQIKCDLMYFILSVFSAMTPLTHLGAINRGDLCKCCH